VTALPLDDVSSQAATVTVVVPTCGRSTLAAALRSALASVDVRVDLVVVDDSGTGAACGVAEFRDPRVRLMVHDRRQGVSRSRNDGIAAAMGEWVAFLDDDDVWAPDKLARQVAAAEAAGRDWVYAGVAAVDDDLRCLVVDPAPFPGEVVDDLPVRNRVPATASNVLVRRTTLLRVGLFDPRFRHLADWDLAVRLAEAGPPAVVPRPLVGYRIHGGGASSDNDDLPAELDLFARRHDGRRPGRSVDRAEVWRWKAAASLRAGHRWAAARAYARAGRAGDLAALPRALVAALDPMAARHARALRRRGDAALTQDADRWLAPLRPPLDRALRDGLAGILRAVPRGRGPALDLSCGDSPDALLVRDRPVVDRDAERSSARADVLGGTELPFAGDAFSLVLCTEALVLVDDVVRRVEEVHRVLEPGGTVVVPVPTPEERRATVERLERLFATFDEVRVHRIPPRTARAYVTRTLLGPRSPHGVILVARRGG
jgi:glycosyltransferase involved in cell wall biosynthesis/SAM-dependent methyltransferase